MISFDQQSKMVSEAISKFPEQFRLKAFPNRRFTISRVSSYVDDNEVIQLYTEVWDDSTRRFLSFAKGTPEELLRSILPLKES